MRIDFLFSITDKNDDVDFDLSIIEDGENDEMNIKLGHNIGLIIFSIIKSGLIPNEVREEVYKNLLEYIDRKPSSKEAIMEALHTLNVCEGVQEGLDSGPIVKPSQVFE